MFLLLLVVIFKLPVLWLLLTLLALSLLVLLVTLVTLPNLFAVCCVQVSDPSLYYRAGSPTCRLAPADVTSGTAGPAS